jgi:iron complex outermembrane recepter protein
MSFKSLLFLVSFLFVSNIFSQGSISGKLVSDMDSTLEFSTVILLNPIDSTVVKSTLTDEASQFEFLNVSKGKYLLKVNAYGHHVLFQTITNYTGESLDLGTISCSKMITIGDEVQIVARKPMLTVTAEKTVLNVSNIMNMTGLNGLEVLRKTPGVILDKDDNISLKGKTDVRIFIDGRPSQMNSADLANMLKGMNASDIESIEVITNPSAKYDASGTGGVINIVLKKNKLYGNNVGIEAGTTYSRSLKYNGALNFNHRDEHFNIFSSYSISGGNWENEMNLYREQQGYKFDQKTIDNHNSVNHNFKTGVDYSMNAKHTLGAIVTGNYRVGEWSNNSRAPISNISTNTVEEILVATNKAPNSRLNMNYNLNYRYADTNGLVFTTDADYGNFIQTQESYQPNTYYAANEKDILYQNIYQNYTPTNISIQTIKSDFEKQLKKTKIGLGYKYAAVQTKNVFDFFNVIDGNAIIDDARSNTFDYTENVAAAYLNFNRSFKKFDVQLGTRYENTHSIGVLTSKTQDHAPVDRKYGNFFPSTAITYNLSEKNVFTVTYSKRIDRPNYQDLNPFENKLDELTYQKGNAFLKPQYSNSVELTHVFMGFITSSVGYTRTDDYMSELVDTLNGNASYLTQTNIDYVENFNFNLSLPIPIKKWWFAFVNFNLYKNIYEAKSINGKSIHLSNVAYNIYMNHSITLKKGWSIDVSGWYNSPSIMMATFMGNEMYSVDAGISKKILDGKGAFKLNFGDIFHTQIWSGTNNFAGMNMKASGSYESQQVRFSFSYRFGNTSVKSELHKSGAEEEKNRISTK